MNVHSDLKAAASLEWIQNNMWLEPEPSPNHRRKPRPSGDLWQAYKVAFDGLPMQWSNERGMNSRRQWLKTNKTYARNAIMKGYLAFKEELRIGETLLEFMKRVQEKATRANESSQNKLVKARQKSKKFQRQNKNLRSQRDTLKSELKRERSLVFKLQTQLETVKKKAKQAADGAKKKLARVRDANKKHRKEKTHLRTLAQKIKMVSTGTLAPKPSFQVGQAFLDFEFKIDLMAISAEDVEDEELKQRLEMRDKAVEELKESFKKASDDELYHFVYLYGTTVSQKNLTKILDKTSIGYSMTSTSCRSIVRAWRKLHESLWTKMGISVQVITCTDSEDNRNEYALVYVKEMHRYLQLICELAGCDLQNSEQELHLRFSADGRELARNNGSVIITVAVVIPGDLKKSHTDAHLHTLALLEGDEKYERVSELMRPVQALIQELKDTGLRVQDASGNPSIKKVSSVKYCADMKDTHTVLGLCTSFGSGKCICTYCVVPRSRVKGDEGIENRLVLAELRSWSLYDRLSPSERKEMGFFREPLLRAFNFSDIIPEPLHLFLRLMDRLLSVLLNRVHDLGRGSGQDVNGELAVKRYEKALSDACGLDVKVYGSSQEDFKLISLWGHNLKDIASRIEPEEIFRHYGESKDGEGRAWHFLFRHIASIYGAISSFEPFSEERLMNLQSFIDRFMVVYVEWLGAKLITPYLHILEVHLVGAIRDSPMKSIAAYSSFSLERKNGMQSLAFFRSTTKNGGRWNRKGGFSPRANNLKGLLERELVLNLSPELRPYRFSDCGSQQQTH